MADPRDLKFFPSDMRLVEHYLSKRIETGNEGFIKDIKLYDDEPWLLPHVKNDLFNENEWFYFVQRTHKAGKTPKRTVPGRGGSSGGTWTSTSSKEEILKDLDGKKIVIGHKAELSYYKHVEGHTKGDATGWCMTEYSLASENDAEQFQEIVLCYIRRCSQIIFKAMNVRRILNNLASLEQREIAANSLRYAAEARRRDPISVCHGMILHYENILNNVKQDINSALNELETFVGPDQVPKYFDLPILDDFLGTPASLDSCIERLENLTIVH